MNYKEGYLNQDGKGESSGRELYGIKWEEPKTQHKRTDNITCIKSAHASVKTTKDWQINCALFPHDIKQILNIVMLRVNLTSRNNVKISIETEKQ